MSVISENECNLHAYLFCIGMNEFQIISYAQLELIFIPFFFFDDECMYPHAIYLTGLIPRDTRISHTHVTQVNQGRAIVHETLEQLKSCANDPLVPLGIFGRFYLEFLI